MTIIKNWFQEIMRKIMPAPEGNAWDEYKRARYMIAVAQVRREKQSP